MLGPATRLSSRPFRPSHRDGFLRPGTKLFGILQQIGRHFVVLHDLTILAVRTEWPHAATLEIGPIRIIDLEVKNILGDQGEEKRAGVDTDAAEHGSTAHGWNHSTQLIDDKGSETRATLHDSTCSVIP